MTDKPLQVLILNATLRPMGNTTQLLRPMMQKLMDKGAHVMYVTLHDKKIASCVGCEGCKRKPDEPGCGIRDDMDSLYSVILNADVIVFATPIYTWYCTAPMKAMIDRLYAMTPSAGKGLMTGKSLALVCTCGDPIDMGCGPFETGMRHFADYAGLNYMGLLAVRDENGLDDFKTPKAIAEAEALAARILEQKRPD